MLPAGLSLIPGTSYLESSSITEGILVSDNIVERGINVGKYQPNGFARVMFQVEIGIVPFESRVISASAETNNGSKTTTTGIDTRLALPITITMKPSLDDPPTYFRIITISALIVAVTSSIFNIIFGQWWRNRRSAGRDKISNYEISVEIIDNDAT